MLIFSSLALANRSAVLFKLAEYSRCVEDIDLALEAGYPPSLRMQPPSFSYPREVGSRSPPGMLMFKIASHFFISLV